MPLTLVLGPANSAKAGEVLGAFTAQSARDAVLVVPTRADVQHYSAELAGDRVLTGLVVTPAGLAGEIARRAGYSARVVSDTTRRTLLGRVLARASFAALAGPASGAGFAAAALALITELERELVTPQRFAAALTAWAGEDSARAAYGRDLSAIVLGYARELERSGCVDRELFAWRALDALRAQPGRWGRTPVFFYGFDDLLPTERDAVETLARIVGADVTVSLGYEAGREALSARAEVVEELRAIADTVRPLPPAAEYYEPGARDALHHLERFLFETAPERIDPGGAVRLLEAGGELAQAEVVAAEVRALLGVGYRPQDIVVVSRSLERSAALLETVCAGYGIRVRADRRRRLRETAVGRALGALARLAWGDAPLARDLVTFLRHPGSGADPAAVDGLEAQARRAGVIEAADALRIWSRPVPALETLVASDPAAGLGAAARELLAGAHRGAAPVLTGALALEAEAVATVTAALAELAETVAAVTGSEVLDALERLELASPPDAGAAVRVAEPLAIRAQRFRAVFVLGLGEDEFPAPSAGEPFLPDGLRRELARDAGLRLPLREDVLARERYLLYACVSRATEQVTLAYCSSDEEGNLVLASPFLEDVAELFVPGWVERRRTRLLADVVWSEGEAPSAREQARARTAGTASPPADADERQLTAAALEHVRHREVVSAGALERYRDCPVRWLVESQLDPPRFGPDPEPMVRGSFLHEVLDRVFSALGEPLTERSLPRALALLESAMAQTPSAAVNSGRGAAVAAGVLEGLESDLRRYLEAEAADGCDWVPTHIELRFGMGVEEGELPALRLGTGAEGVSVRGVIDRIDVARDGRRAVVRDYKSGARRPDQAVARWERDGRLQVALYMLAARRLLGLDPVAGFYQPLRGGDLRPRGVFVNDTELGARAMSQDARTHEELEAVLADAESRALALVETIRGGRLAPCPATCSRDGCAYPGICRP